MVVVVAVVVIPVGRISSLPRRKAVFLFSVTLFTSTWEACTSTTNPVECINTESVPKDGRQKSLVEVLSHLYRVDKVYVAKKVAATSNVSTWYRDQTEYSRKKARKEKKVEA